MSQYTILELGEPNFAAAAANVEEYAEAKQILLAGAEHCGVDGALLLEALGQMGRVGQTPEVLEASKAVMWPGKGDETLYNASKVTFRRYDTPAWPTDSPRGPFYPTGEGAVCVSTTPVLDPAECAWAVSEAARALESEVGLLSSDHSDASNIGTDNIWDKPFPDRLWLRDVPGLLDWFEHRLRTRLFPMLQALYPEAIPSADVLRCHDAFISRYDANGMASLEVHQDTTDFTFTIALNPRAEYSGGGTIFPALREPGARAAEPFTNTVVSPDVGCVASFPGRLYHGGNEITSGVRWIIPLFIYLDVNKSGQRRGYLLDKVGIERPRVEGIDEQPPILNAVV